MAAMTGRSSSRQGRTLSGCASIGCPRLESRQGAVLSEISAPRRIFFGVICAAALFVAYLGLFVPERLDRSFTWAELPPLHANFVGALYLFGGVYMLGCIFARRWSQVSPALPAIGIFTSLLLVVTLLNLEAFDFDLGPVWVWTLSYIVYPAIAFALAWTARGRVAPAVGGPPLAPWARTFLRLQALVFAVVGLLLLVARGPMADIWPWPISEGLAQFYGGPFIAYAYCSWRYSERRAWAEVAAIAPAMLAFTTVTLLDSLEHADLFSRSDVAAWAWFGGFAAATVALLAINARALPAALEDRARPATAPAPAPG